MDEMLMLRLKDCARSTRVGVVDQGFPRAMAQLVSMGYVRPEGKGHVVTEAGEALVLETIRAERTRERRRRATQRKIDRETEWRND